MENILDNIEKMKQVDKSGMLRLLVDFPAQCEDAVRIARDFEGPPSDFAQAKKVLFTGLGGSAIGADLVRAYTAGEAAVPIFVNRDYSLPAFVDANTLVFVSSYSGDTEETLSAFEAAKAKNARIVAISSGGKLGEMAKASGIPLALIPKNMPPRAALGYAFFIPLILLIKLGFIPKKCDDVMNTIKSLSQLRDDELSPAVPTGKNTAKKLAGELFGRFIVLYSEGQDLDAVLTRWRGQLAENSKALSSCHVFPEMTHNEIVGWEFPRQALKEFIAVVLRDKGEHPRVAKRIKISEGLIREKAAKVIEVASRGESLLQRMFSLVYIGDFVSVYLAFLYGVDPMPVEKITYLKKEMAKS